MTSLDEIIESVLSPSNSTTASGNSLIVQTHLSQMKLFGIRQGVELYPAQDDRFGTRKKFIDNIWKVNKLGLYLERMWDLLLCKGTLLLYMRPTKDGTYKIYFYDRDQFKVSYNKDGDISKVIIRYSYKEETNFDGIESTKWVKLTINSEQIEQVETDQQPSMASEIGSPATNTVVLKNTLGYVPCVLINNKSVGSGQLGLGEFDWLRTQLERHENLSEGIGDNLEFFGSPTLVATRTNHELTEAVEGGTENLQRHRTLTSAAGWTGDAQGSRRYVGISSRSRVGRQTTVKKIIGNVQPDERFGYISPDPISPDHTQYFRQNREELHYALGGIDELGLTSNATAYEMKVVYGKVATTSLKKAEAIYTHGLCELFEMAIAAEEDLFKKSLAVALKKEVEEVTDGLIQELMEAEKIPPGVYGLPPIGARQILWRWTGPVFEESADDQQRKSIVCRNMQELGVRSLEALKFFFDNKTEKELEGMLEGGVGFRYFGAIASSLQQTLGLYQQMLNVPTPGNPNVPMAFGVPSPIMPIVQRLMDVLFSELNYGREFDPVAPGDLPNYDTGGATQYAGAGISGTGDGGNDASLPASTSTGNPLPNPGSSPLTAAGINPFPFQGFGQQQPLGGGIQQGGIAPEFTSGIPEPGASLANDNAEPSYGERLPVTAGLPADLAVSAAAPGSVWQQLFPTFTAAASAIKRKGKK